LVGVQALIAQLLFNLCSFGGGQLPVPGQNLNLVVVEHAEVDAVFDHHVILPGSHFQELKGLKGVFLAVHYEIK